MKAIEFTALRKFFKECAAHFDNAKALFQKQLEQVERLLAGPAVEDESYIKAFSAHYQLLFFSDLLYKESGQEVSTLFPRLILNLGQLIKRIRLQERCGFDSATFEPIVFVGLNYFLSKNYKEETRGRQRNGKKLQKKEDYFAYLFNEFNSWLRLSVSSLNSAAADHQGEMKDQLVSQAKENLEIFLEVFQVFVNADQAQIPQHQLKFYRFMLPLL
mmetsp:Transcript_37745/g.57797  ORF Transcript_37745/g.57797 Transcript_37745/m.57797 type:complete len:216 (+) Transcript_37745:252-899(+)|eukprot:CAMPEP_0170491522 /NCGR_PEP_ID=MMETSP0208-20121228/11095_1 /TAXON_ID=197538 /ORGANISM="Strombidium inclinatum, Strain S3" /LENGTH=215 /DNA_ID=CAMNT_0010767105 /DNA_START=254 /DNA_END=901 /DNA_ORIENTATION=+